MTIVSMAKGFAFDFQVLNPNTVAVTKYPLKGQRGWPCSTSLSPARARRLRQELLECEELQVPHFRGLLG